VRKQRSSLLLKTVNYSKQIFEAMGPKTEEIGQIFLYRQSKEP
jgi:hypothetical protein